MLKSFALAAALTFAAAGAASADSLTAQLQSPVAKPMQVIAGGAVFDCSGATCVASSAPETAADVYACRELAKETGAVAAYGVGKGLSEREITRCNAGLSASKAVAKAGETTTAR